MNDRLALVASCVVFMLHAQDIVAQVPKEQLSVPPSDAVRFVIVSPAGKHGTSAMWRTADGRFVVRESRMLRGMVWELDETIHLGPSGRPDHIVVRGITPEGDAAETFVIAEGIATWVTPIDSGSARYDGRSYYANHGGTMVGAGRFVEALYNSPAQTMSLLPNGTARLAKLAELTVGEGAARKFLTAYGIEGLSFSPIPIWMDGERFFGFVAGIGLLPEGYDGVFGSLQKAQDDALAEHAVTLVRRFGQLPPTPVAFTHVKLFDAERGRFVDDQTVVVDSGRITAVGNAGSIEVPAEARVIGGAGKSLVPGLWDAHRHAVDMTHGPLLLASGMTSARDPGSSPEQAVARSARIARGELLFPTLYSSLMIDAPGPLQAQHAVTVASADEAVAAVRSAHERGFSGIKLYSSIKPEWLPSAIAEAKRLGLHVHGHVPATMRPLDAIRAGYDEITHINMVMMQALPDDVVDQSNTTQRFEGPGRHAKDIDFATEPMKSLIAEMAARRIIVDPTLVAFEDLYVPERGDLAPAYAPFAGMLPTLIERDLRGGGHQVPEGLTRADYRASFGRMVELVSVLHGAGVPIVAGTDRDLGLELVRELELYVQAGLTPAEALQTATIAPARLVKADALTGSIAVGKEADLVLVDGDPSSDIGALRRTVWVMSDGRLMNADELREAAGFARPSK